MTLSEIEKTLIGKQEESIGKKNKVRRKGFEGARMGRRKTKKRVRRRGVEDS